MSNEDQKPEDAAPAAEAEAPAAETVDVAALQTELAQAKDAMLRALADAENTRRRAEKQAADARVYAIDKFARDLLPVADTLTRALESLSPEARQSADDGVRNVIEGVEMTERVLLEVFARNGLKRVGAKGDAFDPNLHQAVAQAPADTPANTLAEVMQSGFVLGERTLRPAMVVVSAGPAASAAPPPPQGGAGTVDIKV